MIIIALIINIIYNFYILYKYKTIPTSLSETAYMLGGNKRYLFTAYCVLNVFLILPCLLSTLPENLTFLAFLMCSGLLFSGMSPLFKNGIDKIVHYVSSIFAFVVFIIFMIIFIK